MKSVIEILNKQTTFVFEIKLMKKHLLLLFVLLAGKSYYSKADSIPLLPKTIDSISFNVKVKAIDLSEDGLPGSTRNDEVFLFIYKQNGSCLPQNLCAQFFRFDTLKRTKQFKINTSFIQPTDTLTFILLEQDTQKQTKGIEPVCRLYLNDIYANYVKNGSTNFVQYFDDDDVLGMYRVTGNKFDLSKPIIKKFETLNLFDWAVYKLEISR